MNTEYAVGEQVSTSTTSGILIIWFYLDNEMKVPEELINSTVSYSNQQDCTDYINANKTEIIFLITSDSSARCILPDVHDMRQLDCVFLYCSELKENCDDLFEKYSKIIETFSESDLLLDSIRENITLANQQSESFRFYDKNQKSTRDLTAESANFLWLKVFRDIFVELPLDKNAKEDMICKLKEYYHNNNKQLKLIDKFNHTYEAKDALSWYTGQPFIYKQINRALRTEDIEQLHTFRFFVADLCSSITQEHQLIKEWVDNIKLYRGFTMSISEFQNLKANVGKEISINGFLSTSRSKEVAKVFAGKPTKDKQSILFEIECDVDKLQDAIIFADITRFSKHRDEQEVLFDLGATFEILCMNEEEPGYWLVQLRATDIGEKIAREYVEINRKELAGESSALAYGGLLARIGNYEKALQYYEKLLKNYDDEEYARIVFGIGATYFNQRIFDKAIENLTHAYKLMINADPQRVAESTVVLNTLGNVFTARGEYGKAITHYLEALMNRSRLFGDEKFDLDAIIMCNIGNVYYLEGKDYDVSLKYQMEGINMLETMYPSKHDVIAATLHNIGNCYSKKKDYNQALKYFKDSLNINKQILPPEHATLAGTLTNMGATYCEAGQVDESFQYFTEALRMYEKIFPNGHPDISVCLTHFGNFYRKKHDYEQALQYFEKALDINVMLLPVLHSDIAGNLINIANVFADQGELEEALIYRKLSLWIEEKLFPNGNINIMNNLDNIAEKYFVQGDYTRTIAYSLKTLIVMKCIRHEAVDPTRAPTILFNIAMAFMMKGELDLSFSYHTKALERRNKAFPDGHVTVCSSLSHVATILHLKGEHLLALQYYENALQMYEKLFPDTYQDNYNVGEIFFNISNIHKIAHDLNLAQEYIDKAVNIFHSTTEPGNQARMEAEKCSEQLKDLMKQ